MEERVGCSCVRSVQAICPHTLCSWVERTKNDKTVKLTSLAKPGPVKMT